VTRVLIVNADDFGLSGGVNRGVARAHDEGIVTSASAMVRRDAAEEAAELARTRPGLSVGLHIDLSEWVYRDGDWVPLYEVVVGEDREAVEAEVAAQLAGFVSLFGRQPTHLDSHQHQHLEEPVRSVVVEAGRRLGIPVRSCTPGIAYRGDFYGQTGRGDPFPEAITVEALVALLSTLPDGVTELACHPAAEPEGGSTYSAERPLELEVLCDSRVKEAVAEEGVELRSFSDVSASPPEG
jgi:predicted glycoside hydrolase/deacetylase ChbG (UPF0249 family)